MTHSEVYKPFEFALPKSTHDSYDWYVVLLIFVIIFISFSFVLFELSIYSMHTFEFNLFPYRLQVFAENEW